MARIVILSFDDNDKADAFIGEVRAGSLEGLNAQVEGLFANPTMFCPHSGAGGCSKGKRVRAWSQGKKYGWWVCVVCGKPSGFRGLDVKNPEIWRSVVSQGVNLLKDEDDQYPESVFDEGSGAYSHG